MQVSEESMPSYRIFLTIFSDELLKPGSTCSVTCYAGYEVSGSETIECTDESDAAEGLLLWSDEKWPSCEPKSCDLNKLPVIGNGKINCWNGGKVGEYCTAQCNEGFRLSDEFQPTVMCGTDQSWSGTPKCVEVPTCEGRGQ